MSNLSLREIAQSQLDSTPVIDGQLIVCLDTGNAYRDTATAHVKIGSDLEVVSDLPLAPLAEKIYYLKPDKLYVFLGGNWTLLNDKTIDLDEAIAKLPAESSTTLNDDVEIITQDTDITQLHYYRRKLVVLWEYIKTKAQDFFAAKNHQHGKADITDFPTSMPASDVYPWAKVAKKPSYTKAEVGLGKVDNTADADKTVKYATSAGNATTATKAISADKATSASSADKAAKLTTARTVSGGSDITLSFNYDGSGNSTANIGFYSCKHIVGNTNNYQFHRFAKLDNLTGAYTDKTMLVYIAQDYNGGGFGICRLSLRTNNSNSASSVEAKWLVRSGLSADFVQVAIYNVYEKTYADAFIKINRAWDCTTISALESGGRATQCRTWTLVDSNEVNGTTATDKKTSSECWETIAEAGVAIHKQEYSSSASAIDKGYVASADSANTSSSCAGNSASATKLTSSAGSTTQPIYFKDGKPVATTYTLNKTVPADAKFTDTNTWRGIQNNLTSDSTTDSLSAAQGKVLKDLVDGKAPNGHTHNSIKDAGDDRTLTFAYSKDGLPYKSYSWLAGWNGNELRAVDKNQFATAEHGVTASGSNYVRFGNGTQICWGYKNENGGGTTSFAVAFNNTSYALALTATTKSDNAPFITGYTTTSFSYGRNGPAWDNIQWIAVGTWK